MGDNDGEETKEEQCSAYIHHRVEHLYRDKCRVGKFRHLLEDLKIHTHNARLKYMCVRMYITLNVTPPAALRSC